MKIFEEYFIGEWKCFGMRDKIILTIRNEIYEK